MLKRLLIVAVLLVPSVGTWGATLGDDGLYKEDWFTLTFRDLREDITAAAQENKRLVLIFEQRGCIYCKEEHEQVFSDPKVRDYISANYVVVQYNLHGDQEVTDLDGKALTEKTAARRWGVIFTPTILFMPDVAPDGLDAAQAAVAVMPGAFRKGTFLDFFTWVRDKGYEGDEDFQSYHGRRNRERVAAGELNTD